MRSVLRRIASTGKARRILHRFDLTGDLLRGFRGLHRKRFDFRGDHREAAAGFTRARGFDGGVERQQIRLPRNAAGSG